MAIREHPARVAVLAILAFTFLLIYSSVIGKGVGALSICETEFREAPDTSPSGGQFAEPGQKPNTAKGKGNKS